MESVQDLTILLTSPAAKPPKTQSENSAGFTIYSAENKAVHSVETCLIDTHLKIDCPKNYFCKIVERASLAYFEHLNVRAGVIDHDYKGTIKLVLQNHGKNIRYIRLGQPIAQMIVLPHVKPKLKIKTDYLPPKDYAEFDLEENLQKCSSKGYNY